MPGGVIYMPEVHGKGLGGSKITETYKEQIAAGQQQNALNLKVAQKMVSDRIERESAAKKDIYGDSLGAMYDADRKVIEEYRNHIAKEFQAGVYANDPSMYSTRVKNLNAMIDQAESFYTETFGDDSADGTGNTYRDIQIRHERGNSVEHWAGQNLELKGDEWMMAQKRLNELQKGTFRDVQFMPDGTVKARSFNPETGETGDLVDFNALDHRQIGALNFMPDLREASSQTLMDLAGTPDVQRRLHQLQTGLLTQDGEVTMTDGTKMNVKDMDELEKMTYLSDKYYDDYVRGGVKTVAARNFRRGLINGLELEEDYKDAFVEGGMEALGEIMPEGEFESFKTNTRENWREVTRTSFIKKAEGDKTGTGRGSGKTEKKGYKTDHIQFGLGDNVPGRVRLTDVPFTDSVGGEVFEEPIEVEASTALKQALSERLVDVGYDTEKDNYRVIGATVDPQTGLYIARIQIPVKVENFNPETEEYTEGTDYVSVDISFNDESTDILERELNGIISNSVLGGIDGPLHARRLEYLRKKRKEESE